MPAAYAGKAKLTAQRASPAACPASRTRYSTRLDPEDAQNPIGRWPTNLAFVHGPDCRVTGTVSSPAPTINRYAGLRFCVEGEGTYTREGGGQEEVPVWACALGCPVADLDAQSRYYSQFANDQELFAWLERLITPPGQQIYRRIYE
jgi:hypothetical protein